MTAETFKKELSEKLSDDFFRVTVLPEAVSTNTYLKEEIAKIIFGTLPIAKKRIGIRKLKTQGLSKEYMKLFLKLLDYIGEF